MPGGKVICCEILLAILLPPLGVFLRYGCCSVEFLICLLLTILGYIPGIVYAIYVIVNVDRKEAQEGQERPEYYTPINA